jgi:hypothetical protein
LSSGCSEIGISRQNSGIKLPWYWFDVVAEAFETTDEIGGGSSLRSWSR